MSLLDDAKWHSNIFLGEWTKGGAGDYSVIEPATGDELGRVGLASVEDVATASTRASEAQREWAALPHSARAAVLRRAGDLFQRHEEEISSWIVRESGGIPFKAGLEVHTAAEESYEAAAIASHPTGEILRSEMPRLSFSRRVPAGVVGVIAPFNFPLILSIRSVAPALALGNAVILKPDPRTAVCGGVVLARVFEEAGLPAGVLSVLPGGGRRRRGAGEGSARADHRLHRLDRGRTRGRFARRPAPQARAPGTRRELGDDHHGRRRPRKGRHRRLLRFLRPPGSDLHDDRTPPGRRARRRRVRGDPRRTRQPPAGR